MAKAGPASGAGMRATVADPTATARGPIERSVNIAENPNTPPGPRISSSPRAISGTPFHEQGHLPRDDDEHLVGQFSERVVDEGAVVEPLDSRASGDLAERVGAERVEGRVLGEESRETRLPPRRSCCHSRVPLTALRSRSAIFGGT